MAVKLIEQGLRAVQDSTGFSFTERYRVDGLAGSDRQAMKAALASAGIPALGDPHPDDANVLLVEKRATQDGLSSAIVECTFEIPEREDDHPSLDTGGVYRFSSGLSGDTVREDRNGTIMSVSWSGDMQDLFPDAPALGVSHSDVYEAEVFRPQFQFEISRRLTGAARITGPRLDAFTNVGKVNSAIWGAFAARTVLCTGVDLEEVTPTETRARFAFEYRRETWDVRHISRVFGVIPKNIDTPPGNGLGTFELYAQENFNTSFSVGLTPP